MTSKSVKAERPPLASFCADRAVSLWWDTCKTTRRVSQMPRKEYRPSEKGQSSSVSSNTVEIPESDSQDMITPEDWDDWFSLSTSTAVVETADSDADSDS